MSMESARIKSDLLPETLPVFPLPGVLLLPGGNLPLNIFEPRYLAMVEYALRTDRMMGMIQPREDSLLSGDLTPLYRTGCAGKITSFSETDDGRYQITLTGVSRFDVAEELPLERGFRRVRADWTAYECDLTPLSALDLDRTALKAMLARYFEIQGLSCDMAAIDGVSDGKLVTCLAMICPFDAQEKQALLEAGNCRERARVFLAMLDLAVKAKASCGCGTC